MDKPDESKQLLRQSDQPKLPRWVQVPAGLLLGAVVLLCLAGALAMVFQPNEKAPLTAPAVGVVLSLVCFWCLSVCVRLVAGRRLHDGLFGPRALRALAWFFLLMPIGGLFTGYFWTHGGRALAQTAAYVGIFFGLRALAARRERKDR